MGKYEVLGVLTVMRHTGDHRFFRYIEIHQLMKEQGMSNSYTSVWRSVNGLFSDGLLEVRKEGDLLSRTLSFRVKLEKKLHSKHIQQEYNTRFDQDESSAASLLEDNLLPTNDLLAKPGDR